MNYYFYTTENKLDVIEKPSKDVFKYEVIKILKKNEVNPKQVKLLIKPIVRNNRMNWKDMLKDGSVLLITNFNNLNKEKIEY